MDIEATGGNRNSKFEDGTDNDQHDPETDQAGPSSSRHVLSFHSMALSLSPTLEARRLGTLTIGMLIARHFQLETSALPGDQEEGQWRAMLSAGLATVVVAHHL
jgi:hypothetical protein